MSTNRQKRDGRPNRPTRKRPAEAKGAPNKPEPGHKDTNLPKLYEKTPSLYGNLNKLAVGRPKRDGLRGYRIGVIRGNTARGKSTKRLTLQDQQRKSGSKETITTLQLPTIGPPIAPLSPAQITPPPPTPPPLSPPTPPPLPPPTPPPPAPPQAKTRVKRPSRNKLASHHHSKNDSVLNLHRLKRDGRKTPEDYKLIAQQASSPSQLSVRTISEFYNVPSASFNSAYEVFRYRGYKKLNKIDEGAFGVVSKAVRVADEQIVAVKEVDLSRKRNKRIEEMKRELFVLQKIDSPFIVKLIEHFIISQTLVIIMEFCAGSNLTSYLKETSIGEDEAQLLFKQMACGIKVLHRKGIAHRDVKLNNFLLDATRKNVKVADFGLSVVSYKKEHGILTAKTYCGTEPYMAPEILKRNSAGVRCYNPLYADVWSLGVCLFAMLTRTFPFKMNLTQRSLHKAQLGRRWRFPRNLRDNLSEEIKDLIWHMLDPEPDRRITINCVLAHIWLNFDDTVNFSFDEI